jgi:hypothetical protein
MINPVSCNRGYLTMGRWEFVFLMIMVVFPMLLGNALYPGAGALVLIIQNLFIDFGVAHSQGKTALANQIWQQILNAASDLSNYVNLNCANNIANLESSGFTANKQHGVAEEIPPIPTDLRHMVLGGGGFEVRSVNGKTKHSLISRFRLVGTPEWTSNADETSQNSTVLFAGHGHNTDVEVQLMAKGTHGNSLWSESTIVSVD